MQIPVKIKRVHPDARIPFYATEGSAGADLYAIEATVILPGEVKMIPTGLSFEIPSGYHMQLWDRSGIAKQGVHHLSGIIDSDYRGEVKALLYNASSVAFQIEKGDRIIQVLILPIVQGTFETVGELSTTERGEGGFHSTGRR